MGHQVTSDGIGLDGLSKKGHSCGSRESSIQNNLGSDHGKDSGN
jgi:hypothetical protein